MNFLPVIFEKYIGFEGEKAVYSTALFFAGGIVGSLVVGKIAERWKHEYDGDKIFLFADNMKELYDMLIRICYLTPALEKALPFGLHLYNLWGYIGQKLIRLTVKNRHYDKI